MKIQNSFIKGLRFFSIFTWQLPQSILGFLILILFLWNIKSIKIRYHVLVVEIRFLPFARGISLGTIIFIESKHYYESLFQHEFGHSIQSRIWGPLYLIAIALPSVLSPNPHNEFVVETDADQKAKVFFGEDYQKLD